ncbi:MAG: ABC transporter permease [Clostridia bacterium]|nr:ABC transporter permease [Clostridia bacterium]
MDVQLKKQRINNSNNVFNKIRKSPSLNILIILIIMCIGMTLASDKFLTFDNLFSVSRAFSYIAILALGESLVIITAGIDLSIGSIFGFAGVIATLGMARWGIGILGGVLLGILIGIIFGLFNGFLVTKIKLPPFIATLGSLSIARGLCYVFTRGYPITNLPKAFLKLGQGHVGPVPVPVIIMIGVAILVHIFLNKTVTGRRIFAIGGNMEAARLSGINVERLLLFVYSICGALAAFAGIITASRLGLGQPTAGIGYELDAVAATVIGGASLSGGFASVPGTIFGAAIMGVLRNALVLLNVSAYWQQVVIGTVIIVAVSADQLRKNRSN